MDLKPIYNNEQFMKIYLLITIVISGLTLLFDLLGYLYVMPIQVIADVFIILCSIIIFGLVLFLYENVNRKDPFGRIIRICNHGLLLYLGLIPLFLITGVASASFLIDPTTIGIGAIVISIITMTVLFSYAFAISLICLIRIKESNIWNF